MSHHHVDAKRGKLWVFVVDSTMIERQRTPMTRGKVGREQPIRSKFEV